MLSISFYCALVYFLSYSTKNDQILSNSLLVPWVTSTPKSWHEFYQFLLLSKKITQNPQVSKSFAKILIANYGLLQKAARGNSCQIFMHSTLSWLEKTSVTLHVINIIFFNPFIKHWLFRRARAIFGLFLNLLALKQNVKSYFKSKCGTQVKFYSNFSWQCYFYLIPRSGLWNHKSYSLFERLVWNVAINIVKWLFNCFLSKGDLFSLLASTKSFWTEWCFLLFLLGHEFKVEKAT